MDGFIVDDDTADDILGEVEEDELYDSVCAISDNGSDCLLWQWRNFIVRIVNLSGISAFLVVNWAPLINQLALRFYRCANATCSYFYHPHCISKLLYQEDGVAADVLEKKIVAGEESFTCPIHKCSVCKQGENKNIKELQFAVCRRCPTAYHRKCLPKAIFTIFINKEGKGENDVEKEELDEEEPEVRGWEGLLPKRILIYCLKHEIVESLGTPIRDIKFPGAEEKKKKQKLELPGNSGKVFPKKRRLISEDFHSGGADKKSKDSFSGVKKAVNIKKAEQTSSGPHLSSKVKLSDLPKRSLKENVKSSLMEVSMPATTNVSKTSLGDKLYACMYPDEQVDGGMRDMHPTEHAEYTADNKSSSKKLSCEITTLDADTKRSCLMKKKLEQIGKKCLYKNYDIMQPKNDFNFEKRDWMTVGPDELPVKGSQLIMGINPPLGVNASLANQFIDKALEFKPKLLILIVPPVTVRLDKKKPPYQLVWEHDQFVSGKSFYLPGSVDENDKQMEQWNMTAPPLYLWSRPDWHAKHLTIAQKHGHLSGQQAGSPLNESCHETDTLCHPLEVCSPEDDVSEMTDDLHTQNTTPEEPNDNMSVADGSKECSPHDNGDRENQVSRSPEGSQPKEASGKRKQGDSEHGRETGKKLKKKKEEWWQTS